MLEVNWELGVTLELRNICSAKMISCRGVRDFSLARYGIVPRDWISQFHVILPFS